MKRSLLHFAYIGAIALIGSVGFSACSDDLNEPSNAKVTEVSSNVTGVPVNFVFNVSTTPASTRMNAETVQALGTSFRGINSGRLVAYKLDSGDGKIVTNPGDGTSGTQKYEQVLAEFSSLMSPVATGYDNTANSNRVLEVSLPQGTNTMLFYGVAPHDATARIQGSIERYNTSQDVHTMELRYTKRLSDATSYERFLQVGDMIAAIMTGFADMGFKSNALNTADKDLYFWWDTTTNQPADALVVGWRPASTTYTDADSYKDYERFFNSPQSTAGSAPAKWVARHMTSGDLDAAEDENMKNTRVGTDASTNPEPGNVLGHNYMLYRSNVTWKAYGLWVKKINTNDPSLPAEDRYPNETGLSSLGTILGQAYNLLMEKDVKELRSSSSAATLNLVKDLYQVIEKVANAVPTTLKEFVAVRFAKRLNERIKLYFAFDSSGGISWKDMAGESGVVQTITRYAADAGNPITLNLITTNDQVANFPLAYNIPPGASLVDITYDYGGTIGDKKDNVNYGGLYKFLRNIPNYDLGGNGTSYVTQENYVYPAELMYFGNSPIRVTSNQLAPTDYPNGSSNWIDETKWGSNGWTGASHVTSETKSVAMMNNINYGVALLETKVKIETDANGKIYDNSQHFYGGDDKAISVGSTTVPFKLTGIIIGGQPQKVGWNYTATVLNDMGALASWDRLVYDDQIPNPNITLSSDANVAAYTLLLDNYSFGFDPTSGTKQDGAQDKQSEVYVALEFENNAGDFMGQHNMVRNGARFYLIGKLDPKENTVADPTKKYYETVGARGDNDNHVIPPYNADGTSKGIARVFMQDYKTSVTFKIGKNSLKYAYVTVPNLSASQVSLGLSVDVNWETGIDFGTVILGGE